LRLWGSALSQQCSSNLGRNHQDPGGTRQGIGAYARGLCPGGSRACIKGTDLKWRLLTDSNGELAVVAIRDDPLYLRKPRHKALHRSLAPALSDHLALRAIPRNFRELQPQRRGSMWLQGLQNHIVPAAVCLGSRPNFCRLCDIIHFQSSKRKGAARVI
jgi:hypothetical protein